MSKHVMLAFIGDEKDADSLFIGIREFPTERVYLLASRNKADAAKQARKDMDKFKIPVSVTDLADNNAWEESFKAIADIKSNEKDKEIIVSIATNDKVARTIAMSAAYINGLKAFDVINNEVTLLPVLKFSYYRQLTDKKMDILRLLGSKESGTSLDTLHKKTSMSLPLISYHINGNLKSEGLKELGLVESIDQKGRMELRLTWLGRLLIKGYVK